MVNRSLIFNETFKIKVKNKKKDEQVNLLILYNLIDTLKLNQCQADFIPVFIKFVH